MKQTKIDQIKNVLLNGQAVTSLSALRIARTTRLSAIIYILRHEHGLPIVSGTPDSAFAEGLITDGTRKNMMCEYDSSHFAVYYIKPTDLLTLKNAG
jgi:hypothetical protein